MQQVGATSLEKCRHAAAAGSKYTEQGGGYAETGLFALEDRRSPDNRQTA